MKQVENKRYYKLASFQVILLIGFAFTMAGFGLKLPYWNGRINNLFIVALALNTLALYCFQSAESRRPFSKIVLIFSLIFLVHLPGMALSDNVRNGLFELEKKISLLLFPFILYFQPKLEFAELKRILLAFVAGTLITTVYCLWQASSIFFETGDSSFFFYHKLSLLAGMHAIYLSLYLFFSLLILLFLFFEEKKTRIQSVGLSAVIAFIVSCMGILSARTNLALLIAFVVGYTIVKLRKKISTARALLVAFVVGLSIVGFTLLIPQTRERIKEAINYKGEYRLSGKWGEQQMRPLIWDCATDLIASSPLVGIGTGDVQDNLHNCYIEKDYVSLLVFLPQKFNAHNQYLETCIALGIGGLMIVIFSMLYPVVPAWKMRNSFYLLFVTIFMACLITESMFERQNGVVFFSFFNSLLFFHQLPDSKVRNEEV